MKGFKNFYLASMSMNLGITAYENTYHGWS